MLAKFQKSVNILEGFCKDAWKLNSLRDGQISARHGMNSRDLNPVNYSASSQKKSRCMSLLKLWIRNVALKCKSGFDTGYTLLLLLHYLIWLLRFSLL